MCRYTENFIGKTLKNIYDSRSFIKNTGTIQQSFFDTMIHNSSLESEFAWHIKDTKEDTASCESGRRKPVDSIWRNRELDQGII